MDSWVQIAGTFGVPTALLAALIYWVLIPLSRAHITNLNKIGDALPPFAAAMQKIADKQDATAKAINDATAEAVSICRYVPPTK